VKREGPLLLTLETTSRPVADPCGNRPVGVWVSRDDEILPGLGIPSWPRVDGMDERRRLDDGGDIERKSSSYVPRR